MKRVLKWLAVAIAAGIGFIIALAAIGLAAMAFMNRSDNALSPQAAAVLQTETFPDAAQNGYFAMLGLRSDSPHEYGRRWLAAVTESKDAEALEAALKALPTTRVVLPSALTCNPEKEQCLARYKAKPDDARRLINEGRVLVQHYRQLRDYPAFVEALPAASMRYDMPLPQYQAMVDGQQVVRAEIALAAATGAADRALADLAAEIELHRRMFAGSRLLIMKMVARRALVRDVALLAEFIATQPQTLRGGARGAIEHALRPPAPEELALDNVLHSEMRMGVNLFLDSAKRPELVIGAIDTEYPMRLLVWLARLGYLPVATANRYVELMQPVVEASRAPTSSIETTLAEANHRIQTRYEELAGSLALRNIAGDKLLVLGAPAYGDYILAVRDIEALLRLAAAAVDLSEKNLNNASAEKIRAALAADATRRDPYSGQPFEFDEATASLGFAPRAPSSKLIVVGPRREHWSIALRPRS